MNSFRVEYAHALMFARAIGADEWETEHPWANDDREVPVPLTFARAYAHFDPDCDLRPRPGVPWHGSGHDPGVIRDIDRPGLHAEQHYEFQRPLVVGDRLTVETREGASWQKTSRRGVLLEFQETVRDFYDVSRTKVLTETVVAAFDAPLHAERQVATPPRRVAPPPQLTPPDMELVLTRDLARVQLLQYAGASGDFNPAHTDEVYARRVAGLPAVFAHGMLTMGMASRIVTRGLGLEAVRQLSARLTARVWPGDALIARGWFEPGMEAGQEMRFDVRNQRDETVLTGSAAAAP